MHSGRARFGGLRPGRECATTPAVRSESARSPRAPPRRGETSIGHLTGGETSDALSGLTSNPTSSPPPPHEIDTCRTHPGTACRTGLRHRCGVWFGQKTSAARFPVDVTQRPGPSQPPESAVPSIAPGIDVASVASFGAARARITDQFAELLRIDSPTTRAYKLEQLFASMTLEDAPDILASILAVENARDRSRLVGPFFKQWGKLDGPGAVAKAKELFGRDKRSAMSSAMTGWAEQDPFAAWEVAKEQVPGASPYTASQFSGVVTELAKRDLHAAFAGTRSRTTGGAGRGSSIR